MVNSPEIPINGSESLKEPKATGSPEKPKKPERDPVLAAINSLFQGMATEGALSYEPSAINQILEDYEQKKITGERALELVRTIASSRQDYH